MSLFDFKTMIDALGGPETFTVKRQAETTIVRGRAMQKDPTTFTVQGAAQPAGAETRRMLPEGTRADKVLNVWTDVALQTRTDEHNADVVTIRGEDYEVAMLWDYERSGAYFKAACVRLGP